MLNGFSNRYSKFYGENTRYLESSKDFLTKYLQLKDQDT